MYSVVHSKANGEHLAVTMYMRVVEGGGWWMVEGGGWRVEGGRWVVKVGGEGENEGGVGVSGERESGG